jgi:hypothetical protein
MKWNMGWMNDTLDYISLDPYFRKYNHNRTTFSLTYAFAEKYTLPISHDEVVHGKRSLLDRAPGTYEEKFAGTRTALTYMMTHPGKKLLFMGSEIGQFREWDFAGELEWFLLSYPKHSEMQHYVATLNHFYLENPPLYEQDDSWAGFSWIDADNGDDSVLSYRRFDKAGNEVGCSCTSIRNEDAIHVMYLVTKSLQFDKEAVIGNLLSVVKAVVDMDSTGTDVTKPQRKISEPEESRAKLLDAFLSGIITKEEFTRSRSRLDDEIADPQAMLDNVDRQRSPTLQENKRMEEIERAVREIIGGVEHEDAFYRQILDKMVVYGHDRVDVCLNALPFRWSYSL